MRHLGQDAIDAIHVGPVSVHRHEPRPHVRVHELHQRFQHLDDFEAVGLDLLPVTAFLVVFDQEHAGDGFGVQLFLCVEPDAGEDVSRRGDNAAVGGGGDIIDRRRHLGVVMNHREQALKTDHGRVVGRLGPEQPRRPLGGDRADVKHLPVSRPGQGKPLNDDVIGLSSDDLVRGRHPEGTAVGGLVIDGGVVAITHGHEIGGRLVSIGAGRRYDRAAQRDIGADAFDRLTEGTLRQTVATALRKGVG